MNEQAKTIVEYLAYLPVAALFVALAIKIIKSGWED